MKTATFHENRCFLVKTAAFQLKLPLFMKSGSFHGIMRHSLPPEHNETEGFVLNYWFIRFPSENCRFSVKTATFHEKQQFSWNHET